MRKVALLFLAVSLGAVAGCPLGRDLPFQQGIDQNQTKDGLRVELRVPRRSLVRGETVPVTVVARNLTKNEIVIPAETGALVYVTLWRRTEAGWEQVKRYPETAAQVLSHWRLAPKSSQNFPLNLRVAPDWPTGEPLRMTAELNGRKNVSPSLTVNVHLPINAEPIDAE